MELCPRFCMSAASNSLLLYKHLGDEVKLSQACRKLAASPIGMSRTIQQLLQNAFLKRDRHIKLFAAVLPALRRPLHRRVPLQHLHSAQLLVCLWCLARVWQR